MNALQTPKGLVLVMLAVAANLSVRAQTASAAAMTLVVDETQAARRISFVHEELGVQPGALALAYPRWIPGEHGPTGSIQDVASLQIRSGDVTLPWTRDPDDIFTIRVQVPPGTHTLTVDFDVLLKNTISDHQFLLAWNTVVLYPRDVDKRQLYDRTIGASPCKLEIWECASSYEQDRGSGEFRAGLSRTPDRFAGTRG